MTSLEMGLRFCGMVEDAPRWGTNGSETSLSSLADMTMISSASLPIDPPIRARKLETSATPSRATCHVIGGSVRSNSAARALRTRIPASPGPSEASDPTAPPNCTNRVRLFSCSSRSRCRWNPESHTAHLYPNVTGSACCRCVRPAIGVSRCFSDKSRSVLITSRSKRSTITSPCFICSTLARSMMSCVVAPQCTYFPASSPQMALSCRTRGRIGYPTISVSWRRRSKSSFDSCTLWVTRVPILEGMTSHWDWALARAASASTQRLM